MTGLVWTAFDSGGGAGLGAGTGTARGLGLGGGGSSDLAVTGSGSGLGLGRFADSEKGSSIKKSNKPGWAEPGWCFMIATCLEISLEVSSQKSVVSSQ